MATAIAYDQWDDPGLAFTEEDLASWDLKAFGNERVEYLLRWHRLFLRRAEIPDMPKPEWWKEFVKPLLNAATWYCHALGLEGVMTDAASTLPPAASEEGKALTKDALNADPSDVAHEIMGDVEVALHHAVTIGRRCVGKGAWKKEQKSLSNKLANCLMKERSLAEKMEAALASRSE